MRALLALAILLHSGIALSQIARVKISKLTYSHSTVGTVTQDAIAPASVQRNLKGFSLCHDAGSASDYLAFSDQADASVDGTRLAAGQCYTCEGCSYQTLVDLNVIGSALATGYSIVQEK